MASLIRELPQPLDYVVGSDVVYDQATACLLAPLLTAILKLSPSTQIILALKPNRNEGAFEDFMTEVCSQLDATPVPIQFDSEWAECGVILHITTGK